MGGKNKKSGFTVVELLIIIVIIAILAAILVVAYNGIVDRARNAKTATEVKHFSKATEIQRANTGSYATDDITFAEVLKEAGIDPAKQDPNSTYAFCSSNDKYVLVIWHGVNQSRKKGEKISFVSNDGVLTEHILTNSSLEADPVVITKICNQVYGSGYSYDQWSHVIELEP